MSFDNSSFALRYFFMFINGKATGVTHPLFFYDMKKNKNWETILHTRLGCVCFICLCAIFQELLHLPHEHEIQFKYLRTQMKLCYIYICILSYVCTTIATLLSSNICFRLNSYILSLNYVLVVNGGIKTELQITSQNFKLFLKTVWPL